ncbi:hypothetical protein G6F57_020813 [Rhizopus arrhizus]|nr:hypothetical protein G6F57_020813 [Rhizopus arrhizus]
MDRGPLAARRCRRRPRRKGGGLVGTWQPCRCAGGTAHHDRPVGAAAIERAAPGARALCAGRCPRQAAGRRPRPTGHGRRARLRDGRANAQQGCGAGGAALSVRPLR